MFLNIFKKRLNHREIFIRAFKEFFASDAFTRAAALSYTTILSFIPLVFISLSIISSFAISRDVIADNIFQVIAPTEELANQISTLFNSASEHLATVGTIGTIFFIITILTLFWTIERTFNRLLKKQKNRSHLHQITILWTATTITPILIMLSILISQSLQQTFIDNIPVINKLLTVATPLIIQTFAFTIFYQIIPRATIKLKASIYGAITTTLLLNGNKLLFGLYLNKVAIYDQLYGFLGLLPIALIWIYIMWLIVIFGAKISYLEDEFE